MIILLCGEDSYRLKERLHELMNGFRKKYDPTGLNLLSFSGDTVTLGELNSALKSVGFLGSRRMVIISGLAEEERESEFTPILLSACGAPDEILILFEKIPLSEMKKKPGLKDIIELARVEEFPPLSGAKLASWIRLEAEKLGAKIEKTAIALIQEEAGNDLWFIKTELEKLSSYCRNREIKRKDVEALMHQESEENIFELLDAIGGKNARLASAALSRELAMGGAERIVPMLIKQFRTMIMLDHFRQKQNQPSPSAISKEIGVHEYAVKKSFQALNNFSINELKQILNELMKIERSFKMGAKNPEAVLDLFVGRIVVKA
jgi:DNA polymerase-3 subunit delta